MLANPCATWSGCCEQSPWSRWDANHRNTMDMIRSRSVQLFSTRSPTGRLLGRSWCLRVFTPYSPAFLKLRRIERRWTCRAVDVSCGSMDGSGHTAGRPLFYGCPRTCPQRLTWSSTVDMDDRLIRRCMRCFPLLCKRSWAPLGHPENCPQGGSDH